MIYCRCAGWPTEGYVEREDELWVHALCYLPRRLYLQKTVESEPEVGQVLNLFRFGPHHHELYETKELISSTDYAWISNYRWTSETVTGSESGREARVWVYADHVQPAN